MSEGELIRTADGLSPSEIGQLLMDLAEAFPTATIVCRVRAGYNPTLQLEDRGDDGGHAHIDRVAAFARGWMVRHGGALS